MSLFRDPFYDNDNDPGPKQVNEADWEHLQSFIDDVPDKITDAMRDRGIPNFVADALDKEREEREDLAAWQKKSKNSNRGSQLQ